MLGERRGRSSAGTEEPRQSVLQGLVGTGRAAAVRRYQQKIKNSMWIEGMGSGLGKGPAALRFGAAGSGSAPAPSPEGSSRGDHHPTHRPASPGQSGCSSPARETAVSFMGFCLEAARDGD